MRKIANFLWIEEVDGVYTLGMTPELQDDIGTVGYVEFTDQTAVEVDDILLNLEASKTVMGIVSPLKGTIVEKNLAVVDTPTLLNSEKSEEHWIVKLTDVNQTAFDALENE